MTRDPLRKRAVFCHRSAVDSRLANVVSEAIADGGTVFAIGSIMVNSELITDRVLPYLIGALVWAIGLSLGGPTGNAMNPARDLAPRVAHWLLPIPGKGSSDWGYAWVSIACPLFGGGCGRGTAMGIVLTPHGCLAMSLARR